MNDNCFIDTNILVYCYTGDEPEKQRKALDIAYRPVTYISTQVLTELSNTQGPYQHTGNYLFS